MGERLEKADRKGPGQIADAKAVLARNRCSGKTLVLNGIVDPIAKLWARDIVDPVGESMRAEQNCEKLSNGEMPDPSDLFPEYLNQPISSRKEI